MIPEGEWKTTEGGEPGGTKHQQMVRRLEWELDQRKGYVERTLLIHLDKYLTNHLSLSMKSKLETWENKKKDLQEEIKKLEEYLNSLPPQLDELLASTTQVLWDYAAYGMSFMLVAVERKRESVRERERERESVCVRSRRANISQVLF